MKIYIVIDVLKERKDNEITNAFKKDLCEILTKHYPNWKDVNYTVRDD